MGEHSSQPPTDPLIAWHSLPVEEALASIVSHPLQGLTTPEAHQREQRFGRNSLPEGKQISLLRIFLSQFRSPLIYLLLMAGVIAQSLGHTTDAIVISVVVLLNAVIGTLQENRAERSLEGLRQLTPRQARVIRDGRQQILPASALVPGDILLLEAGDAVPADSRLCESANLQVTEAALTGESVPIAKSTRPVARELPVAERTNMVYAGTHVTAGRAHAVVVATGLATEIGDIAKLTQAASDGQTPLERRIAELGRMIMVLAAICFGLVIAIGSWRGMAFGDIVMIAISQVVGMIPEGLPVAMTVALACGVTRMARRHAVVRRLSAVETLGSTTVICSDKTGTLTRNEMTVTTIGLVDGAQVRTLIVSGVGYAPHGAIETDRVNESVADNIHLKRLLAAATLCNDANLAPPQADTRDWRPLGDPTEAALLTLALKAGLDIERLRAEQPRQNEIPFDAVTRAMLTQHQTETGSRLLIKGAPEVIFQLWQEPIESELRHAALQVAQSMAEQYLRVLAFAMIDPGHLMPHATINEFTGKAQLLGLIGQMDPPRLEARDSVAKCRAAGIRPIMITGDHKLTATAIARQLGIFTANETVMDGSELERLSDRELAANLDSIAAFARIRPAQKLRIVAALQQRGEIVAMTGDGVNDAPALSQADVGIAMGRTGTEIAKEAAKIVITDDNFATIVTAIEEGRVVYRNIKKALLLLLSTSAAEVVTLLLALLLGYPAPFSAIQILWNNLVTEGLITINLVMEPAEGDEMRRPAISPREPLLTRIMLIRLTSMLTSIVIVTLGWYLYRTASGIPHQQVQTETFTLLAICEWYNVLNCRSESATALRWDVLRNPWLLAGLLAGNLLQVAVVYWSPLGSIFRTTPLGLSEVVTLGLTGSLVLWIEECRKFLARRWSLPRSLASELR